MVCIGFFMINFVIFVFLGIIRIFFVFYFYLCERNRMVKNKV